MNGNLPNAKAAVIDPEKLMGYILNPDHKDGSHKARVFAALGFTRANASDLIVQIRAGVLSAVATAGRVDSYGSRFTVDMPIIGPQGSGIVRTGWIIDAGRDVPRLVTAFIR